MLQVHAVDFSVAGDRRIDYRLLPSTPSRKVPVQFATRMITGSMTGGAIGVAGSLWVGVIVGAVIGTFGEAGAPGKMAAAFGKDRPAALIEDAVAIGGAILIVSALS